MTAYYNEIAKYPAAWLRNLVEAGAITAGDVDERSITDLRPLDVVSFDQVHAFAGIGVWSAAARAAGYPDDAELWTGSCPCQPFSTAGKKKGLDDARHLWPIWFDLIRQCRPPVVVGEQVASPDGLRWLDVVRADLEGAGYAFAAFDLSAASVGAPHIRQRLYWVGIAAGARLDVLRERLRGVAHAHDVARRAPRVHDHGERRHDADGRGPTGGLADAAEVGLEGLGAERRREVATADGRAACGMGDAGGDGDQQHAGKLLGDEGQHEVWTAYRCDAPVAPGATRGYWAAADWLLCRDGKARPVEPGTFPLVDGAAAKLGRPRAPRVAAYGNAIVLQVAQTFLETVMEVICES